MATISKNSAGNWKAIIRRKGWPVTSKTFRTKLDAKDWARRSEDEMVRGMYIDRTESDRLTLGEALDRYLREVSPTKRPKTAKAEGFRAKSLKADLGAYSLSAVTPDLVADYRDKRLAEGKSANTVRLELALLSHLFNIAIKEWRSGLFYNPVANIRKPAPTKGRDRRLASDEEARLLRACDEHSNPMLNWMVRIALYTGMRAGEIRSLHRNQVDLDRRIVGLRQTKNGSARTVPLTHAAVEVFREAMGHAVRPLDTTLIFFGEPGKNGKRKPYEYNSGWRKILRIASIDGLRLHDLRHEAISRLVEAGLSDQQVAAISGHKSMQMLKRYTHLRAEDLVPELDKLFG